jgi:hypothetical protein
LKEKNRARGGEKELKADLGGEESKKKKKRKKMFVHPF